MNSLNKLLIWIILVAIFNIQHINGQLTSHNDINLYDSEIFYVVCGVGWSGLLLTVIFLGIAIRSERQRCIEAENEIVLMQTLANKFHTAEPYVFQPVIINSAPKEVPYSNIQKRPAPLPPSNEFETVITASTNSGIGGTTNSNNITPRVQYQAQKSNDSFLSVDEESNPRNSFTPSNGHSPPFPNSFSYTPNGIPEEYYGFAARKAI